jgi:hypothetical protein
MTIVRTSLRRHLDGVFIATRAPIAVKREDTLKASWGRHTLAHVPNRLLIEDGAADDLVRLNVRIPRWLKAAIAEAMERPGKRLNDWVRDALRAALPRELRGSDGTRERSPRTRRDGRG